MNCWQPIETAPKDGRPILIWVPSESDICAAVWWAERKYWYANGTEREQIYGEPTHWMPLPEPPESGMADCLGDGDVSAEMVDAAMRRLHSYDLASRFVDRDMMLDLLRAAFR